MLGGFLAVLPLLFEFVLSGEICTNTGVRSHTARYQSNLLSSKNETWRKENMEHLHLVPSDDQTWANLIPRKMLRDEDEIGWNLVYQKMKGYGHVRGSGSHFLKEISLHDVRLDPDSVYGVAQQTNLAYLLMLDVDRLVWSFRKNAGIKTRGEPYGGWEAPDYEIRGHFVGHYLSATAQMWASTHNDELREKMSSVVSVLSECQNKIGTGYLSAFPSEEFDRFEALKQVWAPYYTIHKILAGLLDQYTLAGNTQALNMTNWMVDYFYKRVQRVIAKHTIERHWQSLNEETGGMNDVLYKLYTISGNEKHLLLAHLFDKPCFLGLLALKADDISGFHSNTHIPIVVGSQLRYEITGEPIFREIGTFFMDIVNSSHSYATGGTSVNEFCCQLEHFKSDPKRMADTLNDDSEESCTTYNMLKVSRYLFRWTKEMAYADYYERALTNGVLGIQRGREPGVMIYLLPIRPGGSKARSLHSWGTKFDSFWCCYGTGIESFSKLGDSIYFEEEGKHRGLYIIQYVPSSVHWRSSQVELTQKVKNVVSWDQRLKVTVEISSKTDDEVGSSTIHLRIPLWTHSNGSEASLNGQNLSLPAPGSFLSITKNWRSGDKISLDLPLIIRSETIKDDRPKYASLKAFLYGPYLLAGLSDGNWDIKIEPKTSLSNSFTPIPSSYNSHLITLTQEKYNSTFVLTNSDQLIEMHKSPKSGTDAALRATFRLINIKTRTKAKGGVGSSVMLETFDYPGMFVLHHGEVEAVGVSEESSVFRLVAGLDGKEGSVSLESESQRGCYLYSEIVNESGGSVKLKCSSGVSDARFRGAASFVMKEGMSEYHPISFIAKGVERNFVLSPLYSFRDESYTVYFNTTS